MRLYIVCQVLGMRRWLHPKALAAHNSTTEASHNNTDN